MESKESPPSSQSTASHSHLSKDPERASPSQRAPAAEADLQKSTADRPRAERTKDYHERKEVYYQNRLIYSWEQDLEDVHIYTRPPPGVTAADLDILIQVDRLRVGLKG